jgi:GT2 family glycosyltransferase
MLLLWDQPDLLQLRGAGQTLIEFEIVICTHNRASSLHAVLERLVALRSPRSVRWSVLVVDNASTDETPAVAENFRARRQLRLRYVREDNLGLVSARLRGVAESAAEWIAFVDDDNLLDPGWLEAMADAIKVHPDAGGLGGRVCLEWAKAPKPVFHRFGYCFAEQELGSQSKSVHSLVGAGMVVRRAALQATGWIDAPLIADRTGTNLVSGGDAEIALRLGGAGFELRYVPHAVMQHLMPPARAKFGYLLRMASALGMSEPGLSLMTWGGDYADWNRSKASESRERMDEAWRGLSEAARRLRGLRSAVVWLAAAHGYAAGLRAVQALSPRSRERLTGAANTEIAARNVVKERSDRSAAKGERVRKRSLTVGLRAEPEAEGGVRRRSAPPSGVGQKRSTVAAPQVRPVAAGGDSPGP